MKFAIVLSLFLCLFCLGADSPWGICSHIPKGYEYQNLDKVIKIMREAGITSVRFDLQFSRIAAQKGSYDFSVYDEVVAKLAAAGIEVLPILSAYDWEIEKPRSDVKPMYQHPEAWRDFVRAAAEHFKGRLKSWEIWNEQDGGFWRPNPNAAQYVPLLKIAYRELKKADPGNQVMVGGLCGWNSSYLRDMYQAGAKGYFDQIAVHPYGHGPDARPQMGKALEEFREVMRRNGDAGKPIWLTEAGGSSFRSDLLKQQPDLLVKAIEFALKKMNAANQTFQVIGVPYPLRFAFPDLSDTLGYLPGIRVKYLTAAEIAAADPKQYPVILGSEHIHLEESYLAPMQKYVAKGGLLLAFGEIPMYLLHYQNKEGNWNSKSGTPAHEAFRLGYNAWWTAKVPKFTTRIATAPGMEEHGIKSLSNVYVTRYLNGDNLKDGDAYTPIIDVFDNNGAMIGQGMALYRYGDRKGAVLGCCLPFISGCTEKEQANLIQRVYLSYLAAGVEKIFIYDFHSDGQLPTEKEHNFGITRWDLTPKPAFHAYRELTTWLGRTPKFIKRVPGDAKTWTLIFQRAEDGKYIRTSWNLDDDKVNFSEEAI